MKYNNMTQEKSHIIFYIRKTYLGVVDLPVNGRGSIRHHTWHLMDISNRSL